MQIIEKETTKIKFQAFGKVTVRSELKTTNDLKILQNEKIRLMKNKDNTKDKNYKVEEIEEEIVDCLLNEQRKKLEKELTSLKDMQSRKGRSAAVFTQS